MRIHINHLILLEEKYGTFEIGTTNNTSCLSLRFGYWRQIPVENLQSMLRSMAVDSSIFVEERLVDEDNECGGELYNYIIYST
jgi:hypothetical protein